MNYVASKSFQSLSYFHIVSTDLVQLILVYSSACNIAVYVHYVNNHDVWERLYTPVSWECDSHVNIRIFNINLSIDVDVEPYSSSLFYIWSWIVNLFCEIMNQFSYDTCGRQSDGRSQNQLLLEFFQMFLTLPVSNSIWITF